MGYFFKTSGGSNRVSHTVKANGALTNLLECVTYDATTAKFNAPELLFDTRRENLRDAYVQVYVSGEEIYNGYLDVDNSTEADSEGEVGLSANSIRQYLAKVWVGQTDKVPVLTYTLGTKWTPKRVLSDLFDRLPPAYKSRVRLGDISVLADSDVELPPTLVFRNSTYTAAIDQVTSLFGDVAFTERHVNGTTYLDFYRIQAPGSPKTQVNIASWGDSVLTANVQNITQNLTSADCVTRVILYGAPRKFIISCVTNNIEPLKALQKDWDPLLEAAVRAAPKKAKPGAPGYLPGMEWVFRRYRLPDALKRYTKLKDLPFKRANGNDYQPQAWIYGTTLTDGPDEAEKKDKIGTLNTEPTVINGVKFDLTQNQIILNSPALNVMEKKKIDNKLVTVYQEAVVGITFCFESRDYINYDTGHDGGSDVDMDFATGAGLTESVHREDLYYAQYTNTDYPVLAEDGSELTFGAIIFNEDVPLTPPITVTETVLVHDDTPILKRLALEKQRERSKRHRSYQITIPYHTRAYREGYLVTVNGQRDYVPDNYMITSVTYDLDNNSTTITADNVKPPARSEVNV